MATIFDEFSQEATAFINPSDCVRPLPGFPEICITTFSQNIITEFVTNHNAQVIAELCTANGMLPVYEVRYQNLSIGLFLCRRSRLRGRTGRSDRLRREKHHTIRKLRRSQSVCSRKQNDHSDLRDQRRRHQLPLYRKKRGNHCGDYLSKYCQTLL